MELDELTMTLRRWLISEGRSPATARSYCGSVRRSWRWLAAERGTCVLQASPEDLAALCDTQRSRASKALCRSAILAARRSVDAPVAPLRAMRVGRRPRMRCRALEATQAVSLASWVARHPGRPAAAVALGLWAGLRRAEIAGLRWDDLDPGEPTWLTVRGKGMTTCEIPLHPRAAAAIAHVPRVSPYVFAAAGGGHVTPTTVWTWIRTAGEDAGLPGLQPHVLRHTAIATANDRTGDLRAVMDLARHARPETTAGYTRTTTSRLIAAAMAVDYEEL